MLQIDVLLFGVYLWSTASETCGWFLFRMSTGTASSYSIYFNIHQSMESSEGVLLSER